MDRVIGRVAAHLHDLHEAAEMAPRLLDRADQVVLREVVRRAGEDSPHDVEPVNAGAAPHGGPKAYLGLFGKKTVRKLLFADLLLGVAPGITGSLLFFFFGQIKGYDHTQASLFMLFYFVAGLVGAPFWAWLATRIGKDKALATASLVFAVFYIGATLVPGGNFALTAAAMFIAGLPYAAGLFLTRAMMADAGDQERFETGVDRTGLMLSILSATTKIGHVLALLGIYRFVSPPS